MCINKNIKYAGILSDIYIEKRQKEIKSDLSNIKLWLDIFLSLKNNIWLKQK